MSLYALIPSCRSLVLFTLLVCFAFPGPAAAQARASEAYGKLPLHFEANRGQTHDDVRFLARGPGYSLYLTAGEAVLVLARPNADAKRDSRSTPERLSTQAQGTPAVLRMSVVGATPKPVVSGLEELPGKANYFIGKDPAKWRTNVPTYAKVHYRSVYPGIDLVYYGNQRQLEYDFVVAPGADPKTIVLGFQGTDKLEIDAQGDLVLHAAGGSVRQKKPFIYQEIDGIRREIEGAYILKSANQVGFKLAAYDRGQPLIIDPVLLYSTYLGGSGVDAGRAIAVDTSGNAYVTGETLSLDFPTTLGAFQTTFAGGVVLGDAFVTKLNPTGSGVVYSTYLGGSGEDQGLGIAVDNIPNAYVTGRTNSTDFPTTPGAFDTTHNEGEDAFVTKLDPTGSALVYSTYLGGRAQDSGNGIAVDGASNAYVIGTTISVDFPTTAGAFDTMLDNGDAFVTKLNATGSAPLVYSTFLGGSGNDFGNAIALDPTGDAYLTGQTSSPDFPTTPTAFDSTLGGTNDAFVTRLLASGSALVYSTFLGGSNVDFGLGIALDSSNNAYVTGQTESPDFPTTPGAFDTTLGGPLDAFVTKLNSTGSAPLVYSTYLGGSSNDAGIGIAVDASFNAYVTGATLSTDFPTINAIQATNAGAFDAFVTKVNPPGTGLVWSTYLGGNSNDFGNGIALDILPSPNAYVTGFTGSANFPRTPGAFDTTLGGPVDAFVAKIGEAAVPPPQAVVLIIDEESIDNGNPPNFFTRRDVNDDVAEIGVRAQLRFFRDNPGKTITLHTGQVGDEGWFALKKVPESWAPAGGLAGYIGNPGANPEDPPPHGTGPGLGAPDANGDRESLLDKVPDVTPLRATGLKNLEGRDACAVVYDSNITINYDPLNASLKGANLGTVAFKVLSVTPLTGYSSSSLPQVEIMILDAREACRRALLLLTDTEAPAPTSLSEPFDVMP